MADVEEVGAALKGVIAALVYPNGTAQPSASGFPTKILQGWPGANLLNAWLPPGKNAGATGGVLVSVYPQPNMSTNVTRFQEDWEVVQPAIVPVSVALAAEVATFTGSATAPTNIAFTFGTVSVMLSLTGEEGYDAAGVAAAAAACLVANGWPATASGPAVTADRLTGVTVQGIGTLIREVARVKQGFQITVWAPSQPARVATAKAFMAGLFAMDTLALQDGTKGNLFYLRDTVSDEGETQLVYRRDVFATVEFAITETVPGYGVGIATPSVTSSFVLPG